MLAYQDHLRNFFMVLHIFSLLVLKGYTVGMNQSYKKKEDLKNIIFTEVRQRKTNIKRSLMCGILKNDTNELV